ncbi:secondary thiamine-phosphate synthase enzyme YjbQ [Candidatus Woesearchaeota archaeon]|nr:secondary thiamine-phosphate synthase enzyme YjbQ [Candidatus Woesearchaeota archaeon]
MKTHTKELFFNTEKRHEFINITDQVQDAIEESGVKEGLVLVNPMHITAAVYVNDAESGLIQDFQDMLKHLVPEHPKTGDYKHNATGEDNAYAHMWRTLMGHQVTMAITKSQLHLGPWEQIYYAEFDGQRRKRVLVKIIGE